MGECTGAYNLETPAAALSLCNAPKCVEGWGFSRCAFPLRLPPSWSCTRLPRCQETSMQSLGAQPSSTQSSSAYNRQGYRFAQTHKHTHTYVYVGLCTYTCICVYVHVRVHVRVHVHVYVHVYVQEEVHVHVHVPVYVLCLCTVYVYIHTYIHIYIERERARKLYMRMCYKLQ